MCKNDTIAVTKKILNYFFRIYIFLFPIISKIIEKTIHKKLMCEIIINRLIPDHQYYY